MAPSGSWSPTGSFTSNSGIGSGICWDSGCSAGRGRGLGFAPVCGAILGWRVGAAITTIGISYAHVLGSPLTRTLGASGEVFAILMAFGVLFGENEIMMIPFPFMIKAKYFVGILIVVTLAFAMSGSGGVAYVAHLGGLLFGWLYVRRGPKPAMVNVGLAERYYGMRNSYYRWKRRRQRRSLKSTCGSTIRKCTLTSTGTTFLRMTTCARGTAAGSRGG